MRVTNLPNRDSCPDGIRLLILRPALRALQIDFDEFMEPFTT